MGREREDVYNVAVDWLYETEANNEWMSEEDYEVDENGEAHTGDFFMTDDEFQTCFEKPKKKPKRKRSPSPPKEAKGRGKGKNQERKKMMMKIQPMEWKIQHQKTQLQKLKLHQ